MIISVDGRKTLPWVKAMDSPATHTYIKFGLQGDNIIRVRAHEDTIKVLRYKALRNYKKKFGVARIEGYDCDLKGEVTVWVPRTWREDLFIKEKALTFITILLDGTHVDKYDNKAE